MLAGLIAQGALYRLGVSRDVRGAPLGLGPFGLQFGAAELRLLAAAVLVGLFLGLVLLALGVLLVIIGKPLQISFDAQEWLSAPEGWRLLAMAASFCWPSGASCSSRSGFRSTRRRPSRAAASSA